VGETISACIIVVREISETVKIKFRTEEVLELAYDAYTLSNA
jgi:hypothetical protein